MKIISNESKSAFKTAIENKEHSRFLSDSMQFDFDRFKRQEKIMKKKFKEFNLYESSKAMKIALKCHVGKRKNGFEEVSHQFEIISMVFPLFQFFHREVLDSLIASMFLHDVIEDYPNLYNFDKLKKDFGNLTFEIVKRMTKTKGFSKTKKDYEKYYKKLSKHPLSVISKLFDRIHNYESMDKRDFEFKIKYFKEVEEYLIPMAKKARNEYPQYEQIITFLIRQLKVLSYFHVEIILARGEDESGKDYK